MRKKVISTSAEQTRQIGRQLAKFLRPNDVILFFADLGAGKTTFSQGIAQGLGAKDAALSPTFVVAETIHAKIPIHHLDFYRLKAAEVLSFGIEDYLTGSGIIAPGLVLIEWADRFPMIWPKERLEIHMKIQIRDASRSIELIARGKRYEKLLKEQVLKI